MATRASRIEQEHDLELRKAEFIAARNRTRDIASDLSVPLESMNLALVEHVANDVAAAFRQLATAAWELARARTTSAD